VSSFVFELPTRVIFGPGAIDSVGGEARALGSRALLITASTFARKSGLVGRLIDQLSAAGTEVTLYADLEPNPTVGAIDRGAEVARAEGSELVLGLGGGSALDGAKAIAATACDSRSVWDFTKHSIDTEPPPIECALPIIQIPIIASTGSETNSSAVVYDQESGTKAPLDHRLLFARVAIVDPTLTFSVPAHYTAVGAMNIVSQMLESYLTNDEFAVTDRVTEGLMRVVMDSLARAMRQGEDLDARNNLSWAATMASTVALAGRGGSKPLLALAHPLTARFPIEHGVALAALWPSFMRYALANRFRLPQVGRYKRYALLGRQLFGVHETDDEVAAELTTYRFVNWLRSMNMPTDLGQLGVDEENLDHLADQAVLVSGNGKRLPSGLTAQDIDHIYEGALRPIS
jgi:alcohol dehydrogenase YqhD (iron-dependent ADH family)